MKELEKDRVRDGPVDGLQNALIQLRCTEGEGKDLDLLNAMAGREIDGLRGEFMAPKDLSDLGDEEFLQSLGDTGMGVDLGLRNDSVKLGLLRKGKHGRYACDPT